MSATAIMSPDGAYRYYLSRVWNPELPKVLFIMLNPSTADATKDDPTIRKCIGFAKRWHCGGLLVVNLFAYRATDPAVLKSLDYCVGPQNDNNIRAAVGEADVIVCAWGAHGRKHQRSHQVLGMLKGFNRPLHAVKLLSDGTPAHPLYVPYREPINYYTPERK